MLNSVARESLQSARHALQDRDFASAALAFSRGAAIEPDNPAHLHGAAVAARRLGDLEGAENLYRAAIEIAADLPDNTEANVAIMAMRLVDLYRSQDRISEAERLCIRVLDSRYVSRSRIARGRVRACLGELYKRQGRLVAAEQAFRAAIADRRASFGDRHPKTAQLFSRHAEICRMLGEGSNAGTFLGQARSCTQWLA